MEEGERKWVGLGEGSEARNLGRTLESRTEHTSEAEAEAEAKAIRGMGNIGGRRPFPPDLSRWIAFACSYRTARLRVNELPLGQATRLI